METNYKSTKVCYGCGLPPRKSETNPNNSLPLRRCSRCRNAWYHDEACQRKHLKEHRKYSVSWKMSDLSTDIAGNKVYNLPARTAKACFRLETRNGRGRCVIAARRIPAGEPIGVPANTDVKDSDCKDFFRPLVPPVLNEKYRSVRCALCFGELIDDCKMCKSSPNMSNYPVLFCSKACLQSNDWGAFLEHEEKAVFYACFEKRKEGQSIIPRILPSAILLYRILKSIASEESDSTSKLPSITRARIEGLQLHTDDTKDGKDHADAVITTTIGLLQFSIENSISSQERDVLSSFSVELLSDILLKMRTNGFSVCDGESSALGLGLFPIASAINHSCQPNAIQTFMYGEAGRLPLLRITSCNTIPLDQEICISYIDTCMPRDIRRQRLQTCYYFRCTCPVCCDDEEESRRIGLLCVRDGCKRSKVLQRTPGMWTCTSCGNTDFKTVMEKMKKFNASNFADDANLDNSTKWQHCKDLENVYNMFKSSCHSSSWYVRESSENLVQAYLDCISICSGDDRRIRELSYKAFNIIQEILSSYSAGDGITSDQWLVVRINVLRYKAAKLHLFLFPDPCQPILVLQDVYKNLSPFFPKTHEFMIGLTKCLQEAAM